MKIGAKCGGTSPQRLGWTASSFVEIRNCDAKNGAHHAENTLRLGRLLDRQRQYFVFESTRRREIGLALSDADQHLKRLIKNARFPTVSAP